MTEVNSNLIAQQQKDKQEYEDMLEAATYSLNKQQYDELISLASRYESLCSLLPNVVCIFDFLNSSIFDFIETIKPNPVK